jgi:hypothetical protein
MLDLRAGFEPIEPGAASVRMQAAPPRRARARGKRTARTLPRSFAEGGDVHPAANSSATP